MTDFDRAERPATVTDPLGNQTHLGYDRNGNLTRLSEPGVRSARGGSPGQRITTYTYDGRDLPSGRPPAKVTTSGRPFRSSTRAATFAG